MGDDRRADQPLAHPARDAWHAGAVELLVEQRDLEAAEAAAAVLDRPRDAHVVSVVELVTPLREPRGEVAATHVARDVDRAQLVGRVFLDPVADLLTERLGVLAELHLFPGGHWSRDHRCSPSCGRPGARGDRVEELRHLFLVRALDAHLRVRPLQARTPTRPSRHDLEAVVWDRGVRSRRTAESRSHHQQPLAGRGKHDVRRLVISIRPPTSVTVLCSNFGFSATHVLISDSSGSDSLVELVERLAEPPPAARQSALLALISSLGDGHGSAERGGFEPPSEVTPATRFPVVPVQPLRHLSWNCARALIYGPPYRSATCRRAEPATALAVRGQAVDLLARASRS